MLIYNKQEKLLKLVSDTQIWHASSLRMQSVKSNSSPLF